MADNVVNLSTDMHPFARYLDGYTEIIEAPEFVVDDVVAAGTVVVAGERGLGKTSTLVPLMICPTGLLENYPLESSIRRKVVYIAEDAAQVRRIISAMRAAGLINAERDEFNECFRLVEAKRMPAHEIVQVVPYYDDLWTPNQRVDGTEYLAAPVVVLDTTNATINLENISDNAQVSQAVAMLRQKFGPICLLLVGHVSKASRSDAKQLSFVGAGSWEGDTQQSIYLVSEDDQRYMVIGKKRFEADITEYKINSGVRAFDAKDKLGRIIEIKCFYGLPEATTEQAKKEARAERQSQQQAASWQALLKSVRKYVGQHPGSSTRAVSESVSAQGKKVRDALAELVEQGEIEVREGPRKAKYHHLVIGTQSDTVED